MPVLTWQEVGFWVTDSDAEQSPKKLCMTLRALVDYEFDDVIDGGMKMEFRVQGMLRSNPTKQNYFHCPIQRQR